MLPTQTHHSTCKDILEGDDLSHQHSVGAAGALLYPFTLHTDPSQLLTRHFLQVHKLCSRNNTTTKLSKLSALHCHGNSLANTTLVSLGSAVRIGAGSVLDPNTSVTKLRSTGSICWMSAGLRADSARVTATLYVASVDPDDDGACSSRMYTDQQGSV